jgi:hypothetical protein
LVGLRGFHKNYDSIAVLLRHGCARHLFVRPDCLCACFPFRDGIRKGIKRVGPRVELMLLPFHPIEETELASTESGWTTLAESGPICRTSGEKSK